MEDMEDEHYTSVEYSAGDRHGTVDYDTFRVVKEVHRLAPKNSYEYKQITFSKELLHAGIIASVISEMLPAFSDENIPSLTVTDTTLSVLDMLGIPYHTVEHDVLLHAENSFESDTHAFHPMREKGDDT